MGDELDEKRRSIERRTIAIRRLSITGLALTAIGVTGAAMGFPGFAFVVGAGVVLLGAAGTWLAIAERHSAASNRKSHQ